MAAPSHLPPGEPVICGYKPSERCLFQKVDAEKLGAVSQVALVLRKFTAFMSLLVEVSGLYHRHKLPAVTLGQWSEAQILSLAPVGQSVIGFFLYKNFSVSGECSRDIKKLPIVERLGRYLHSELDG